MTSLKIALYAFVCTLTLYPAGRAEGQESICLIIDEETIDNGISTIDQAAASHGVDPDFLINDDMPTEFGNPPLRWNTLFPGDVVLLPSGEEGDEGWFALPETIAYADDRTTTLTDEEWIAAFKAGTLPQDLLDKVLGVMPLRNPELLNLLGSCASAIVYDSDISSNTEPLYGNLQGARYGRFTFKVIAVEAPGSIPESQSSSSLFDLRLQVLSPSSTLTVTKSGTGSGTVTSMPAGIDCGSDCTEDYDSCEVVTLTPTPDQGSVFVAWSGDPDCSDGVVTMDGDKSCDAQFDLEMTAACPCGIDPITFMTDIDWSDDPFDTGFSPAGFLWDDAADGGFLTPPVLDCSNDDGADPNTWLAGEGLTMLQTLTEGVFNLAAVRATASGWECAAESTGTVPAATLTLANAAEASACYVNLKAGCP